MYVFMYLGEGHGFYIFIRDLVIVQIQEDRVLVAFPGFFHSNIVSTKVV